MSTINTILDNGKSGLEGITVANGYKTNVAKVERYAMPYDILLEEKPFIAIVIGGEEIVCEDDTNVRFKMILTLSACLQSVHDLDEKITEFGDDIKKYLYSSLSLGTGFLGLRLVAMESFDYAENIAGIHFGVELLYWAAKSGF